MNPEQQSPVLDRLARPDKWYLGGGNRLIWTPPFPVWLDHLGFWDRAQYYHLDLEPGYAVTLLDEDTREIPYRFEARTWRPDRLTQRYRTDAGLTLTEHKALHPEDVLLSRLTLGNTGGRPRVLRLVLWTAQPSALTEVADAGARIRFVRHAPRSGDPHPYHFGCALGLDRPVQSVAATPSQGRAAQPHWRFTPFYEALDDGTLGDVKDPAPTTDGLLYLGLLTDVAIPPRGAATVTFGLAAAPTTDEADQRLQRTLERDDALEAGTKNWHDHFGAVPSFVCSDPFIQTYYWYRWYGLRLFTLQGGEGNYPHPAVCEGPGSFRVPITYSAQCHILETRWMHRPDVGRGSLLNFIHNQKDDGSFPGNLYLHGIHPQSFYHANWAHLWDLHQNHPDETFLQQAYEGLRRYADYFDRTRDRERSGLYDIRNHYETGQEYMHRYLAVDEHADAVHWGDVFRLKGVDVTVYLYQIKQLLARLAQRFERPEEAARWEQSAEKTRRAVREQMWDPRAEMFFDVDPRTGERTGVKAAVCFYPYCTDLVEAAHLPGLKRHLLDPEAFWTPYPVPSSSRDDPYFNPQAQWKGQRMNCPWNGRVWPMVNSHIAEALARSALRFDDALLRQKAVAFIDRFIRMMYSDGDVNRPNCYEHYNPFTGKACLYRGVDDYQHSWVVELIIKYVCGIRPREDGVTVDPFPFDLASFRIEDVPVRGRRVGVERNDDRFSVWIDGAQEAAGRVGTPILLTI